MLISKAQLALAAHEADEALKFAKESITVVGFAEEKQYLEGPALKTLFGAYIMKGMLTDAEKVAAEMLAAGQKYKDQETVAGAHHATATALIKQDFYPKAMVGAHTALESYKELGSAKGQAAVLTTMAKIYYALDKTKDGVESAEKALVQWREAGYTKGLANALEVLFQGKARQDDPMAGLRAANAELDLLQKADNVRGQADVYEMLARTHALLGEPVSALKCAADARAMYTALGDKMGEASIVYMMAEMYRAQEDLPKATVAAETAMKLFRSLGSKWGEEQCRQTLSTLYMDRGHPEKAPDRSLALQTLSKMIKAIEARKEDDFKACEKKLNDMQGLIKESDLDDTLFHLLQRDAEAVDWLETQGWEFDKTSGKKNEKMVIKTWSKRLFYLNHLYGGMGFGPNFRHVTPHRIQVKDKEMPIVFSLGHIEPTDEWVMNLEYHPGHLDAFQVLGANGME
jgi:tetratricopeptide (TPR) repeat protein